MSLPVEQLPATIRRATVEDIPVLRDLADRTWREAYAEIISAAQIDYMLGWMYSPEQIAKEIGAGVIWEITEVEDQPAGFCSLTFVDQDHAKLNRLYVLPERQGLGLGSRLLTRVQELARERGVREISLQVNKQNARAIRRYERAGYNVSHSAVFDIGGGFVMDDYIMTQVIAPSGVA